LIIGKKKSIDHLIDELKRNEFNLKVERNVNEYLSFYIEESKEEGILTMIQPHLLTHLINNFREEIKGKGSSILLLCQDLKSKAQQLSLLYVERKTSIL
jgi:hypothetical protein